LRESLSVEPGRNAIYFVNRCLPFQVHKPARAFVVFVTRQPVCNVGPR
jgi:hypothetical protein